MRCATSTPHRREKVLSLPLWGFIAVTAPLVLSPGATTAVVLRNSIGGGARSGLYTALGANSGSVCYGLLTAFGFALALQRWPSVWLVLRWTGVAYLTWLALQSLRGVFGTRATSGALPDDHRLSGWRSFTSGYLTNVLNPSLAAFYLIVVPQFVPREAPFALSVMTLMLVHISMAFPWHSTWAITGATLARVLSRRRPRQLLDAVTGIALLWLAVKVAF